MQNRTTQHVSKEMNTTVSEAADDFVDVSERTVEDTHHWLTSSIGQRRRRRGDLCRHRNARFH